MPPKRIKTLGWTFNFANPISIIFAFGIIGLVVFILKYF
jgi:uncharacterized membrane protein